VTPNRGMGPPWGAFCQITLTSCYYYYANEKATWHNGVEKDASTRGVSFSYLLREISREIYGKVEDDFLGSFPGCHDNVYASLARCKIAKSSTTA